MPDNKNKCAKCKRRHKKWQVKSSAMNIPQIFHCFIYLKNTETTLKNNDFYFVEIAKTNYCTKVQMSTLVQGFVQNNSTIDTTDVTLLKTIISNIFCSSTWKLPFFSDSLQNTIKLIKYLM